jgi:hypothetical protein
MSATTKRGVETEAPCYPEPNPVGATVYIPLEVSIRPSATLRMPHGEQKIPLTLPKGAIGTVFVYRTMEDATRDNPGAQIVSFTLGEAVSTQKEQA